ncbi:hypothetical protein PQX77_006598 [Marasmius sp. AFHP31]|nr:hypothetical protein PQX77_006598 [Marasmius sp. AFHP31]
MRLLSLLCVLSISTPYVLGAARLHRRHWTVKKVVYNSECKDMESCFAGSHPVYQPPAQQDQPTSPPSDNNNNGGGVGSTGDANKDLYLKLHNDIRGQHGAGPLQWNNTLETAAQKWANGCVFEHSRGAIGPFGGIYDIFLSVFLALNLNPHFSENLSTGTGDFGIDAAVKLWTDEAGDYNPSNPQYSHFTQMVWKESTQVGCAVATGCNGIFDGSYGPAKLYVCEYYPAGNVIGDFQSNVQV